MEGVRCMKLLKVRLLKALKTGSNSIKFELI